MATPPTSEDTELRICVLAFARVREIVGSSQTQRILGGPCTLGELWVQLVDEMPALGAFSSSIRFACNGEIAEPGTPLRDGDEVALLPPVSGG